jgi:hypothetical protein
MIIHCADRHHTSLDGPDPLGRDPLGRLLRYIYPIPNWLDSQQQYDAYNHLDIPEMSIAELQREQHKLHLRIDLDENPDAWFFQRLAVVEARLAQLQRPIPQMRQKLPSRVISLKAVKRLGSGGSDE